MQEKPKNHLQKVTHSRKHSNQAYWLVMNISDVVISAEYILCLAWYFEFTRLNIIRACV